MPAGEADMSRWSPTVTPTGVSVLGSAIRGGAEGWEAGREETRRKRRDELAEAMTLGQMSEWGISRRPENRVERGIQDAGVSTRNALRMASGAPADPLEQELIPLGEHYVQDLSRTPSGRAERERLRLDAKEAAAQLAGVWDERQRYTRGVDTAAGVRREEAGMAAGVAAQRHRDALEIERLRAAADFRIAGIRAAPDPEEEARANLAERDQIIQEQTAATFAAKDRYGVDLGRPSLRTRADTTAFTADTSRINQMTRDLDVLRNQAPGAVQRPKTREQAQARAHQLQRQGKSRAQILQIMTREGYSVR